MAKARKLDIFQALNAVDRRDFGWLARQPEDDRKEFNPVAALRWAATCKTNDHHAARMLWLVNERVNRHMYLVLHRHPDLLFRLLASCGTGQSSRREYLKARPGTTNKAINVLAEYNPQANQRELKILMSLHTRESFADFLADCGIQADDAREILKSEYR